MRESTGAGGGELPGARQVYLAQLAAALITQGLVARTFGDGDEAILRAYHPATRRSANVACVLCVGGWTYVWSRGGEHPADDPAGATEKLARSLS